MDKGKIQELIERLREEGLGWGIGPAGLCQEAAEALSALLEEVERLEKAKRSLALDLLAALGQNAE